MDLPRSDILSSPSEAPAVGRPLPNVLPSSLEHLTLHTVSECVLVWFTGLPRHGWELRAWWRLTINTRRWQKKRKVYRLYTLHSGYSYVLRALDVSLWDAETGLLVCNDAQCSLEWPEPEHRRGSLESIERS